MTAVAAAFGLAVSAAAHLTTQVQLYSVASKLQVQRFDDLKRIMEL